MAEGRPIKAIAAAQGTTPAAASEAVEKLFLRLAQDASGGGRSSLRRLRMLHEAIVNREEQGETLSRLLPGGVAEMLRSQGRQAGETKELVVSVLMSDIRGYSTIAEHANPSALAGQLNIHRAEMNKAILSVDGHGHAVRRRRGHGRVRSAGGDGGPRRPGPAGRAGHAPGPGRGERGTGGTRACPSSASASG